jgi:hypothetical protein
MFLLTTISLTISKTMRALAEKTYPMPAQKLKIYLIPMQAQATVVLIVTTKV